MVAAMKPVPHWHRDTRMTMDLRRALITAARPNPLVAAWRWRYEIALLAGLAAIFTMGTTSVGILPTIAIVSVITAAVLGLPPTRQFVLNRAWCIITAHRVRVGCAEAMIYSSRGKIPIILWTAHQPFGERVLLCAEQAPALTTSLPTEPYSHPRAGRRTSPSFLTYAHILSPSTSYADRLTTTPAALMAAAPLILRTGRRGPLVKTHNLSGGMKDTAESCEAA